MRRHARALEIGQRPRPREHQRGAFRRAVGRIATDRRADPLARRGRLLLRFDLFALESARHSALPPHRVRPRAGAAHPLHRCRAVIAAAHVPDPAPADEDERRGREPQPPPHVPRLLLVSVASSAARVRTPVRTAGGAAIFAHNRELTTPSHRWKRKSGKWTFVSTTGASKRITGVITRQRADAFRIVERASPHIREEIVGIVENSEFCAELERKL